MTELEYDLGLVSEESAEIIQNVSKALRFSLDEIYAGQPLTNEQRIEEEIRDLLCVIYYIQNRYHRLMNIDPSSDDITKKWGKIEHYKQISRAEGVIPAKVEN